MENAMDENELMKSRHSVRRFTDRPLEAGAVAALNEEIDKIIEGML